LNLENELSIDEIKSTCVERSFVFNNIIDGSSIASEAYKALKNI
jgi:hypothetical protein